MTVSDQQSPGMNPWRPFPADPADWYSAEEMAKADEYVKPVRRVTRAAAGLGFAVDVAIVAFQLAPRFLSWLGVTNWVAGLALTLLLVGLIGQLVSIPVGAWRELSYDKKWGFSNQTVKGFVLDVVKGVPLGIVVGLVLYLPLWAVVRATDWWWLIGWAIFALFNVGFGMLFPVVIAPIFNKYTPLDDGELRTALLGMADEAGADIAQVMVEDSSKRDTRPNAHVAGLGKTRRLVLYDTILGYDHDEIVSVAAHEIGHWKLHHLARAIPTVLGASLAVFVALKLILERDAVLDFAGVDSLGDPAALPVYMLAFTVLFKPVGLFAAWLTRAQERQADLFAFDLLGHAGGIVGFFRKASVDNLMDLRPSWWNRLNRSHPPVAERMAMGTTWDG